MGDGHDQSPEAAPGRRAPVTRSAASTGGSAASTDSSAGPPGAPPSIRSRTAAALDQAEQLRALADVGRLLSETLDPDVVARRVVESICALLGAQLAAIYCEEPETGRLVTLALLDPTCFWTPAIPRGAGVAGLAVRDRCPVASSDVLNDPRLAYDPDLRARIAQADFRALLAVPLVVRDRLFGVLAVGDRTGRVFDDEDVRLAEAFADQAALALENARLYEETARGRREAELLAELAQTINASHDVGTILQRVAEGARDLCAGDMAIVALRDPGSAMARVRHTVATREVFEGLTIAPGEGIGGPVLLTGQPFRTDSYADDPRITGMYLDTVQREGIVAAVVVPIASGEGIDGPAGLLYAARRTPRRFTDHDEATLTKLADHAAIAIRNVRLVESLQGRATRLRTLAGTSQMVSSSLTTDAVLGAIARAAAAFTGAANVFFWIADEAAGTLEATAFSDPGMSADFGLPTLRFGESATGWVAQQRKSLNVPDVHAPDSIVVSREWWHRHGLTSFLGVPVLFENSLVAVLGLVGRQPFTVDADELDLLDGFASQAAVALRNARLFGDAREYAERLRALEEVNRLVSSSLDMDEVLNNIAAAVARFFDATFLSIWELDPVRGSLRRALTHGDPELGARLVQELAVGEGGVGWVVQHREPLPWVDIGRDPRPADASPMLARGLRYLTAYPIAIGDRVLGALSINRATPGPTTPETVALLGSLVAQAAVAMDNARLYSETARRLEQSHALLEVVEILNSTLEPRQLLKRVAMKIARICHVDRCTIERWDGSQMRPLTSQFADGGRRPELWSKLMALSRGPANGAHARAIATREPVVIDDTVKSDLIPPERIAAFDLRSYMAVPLIRQDVVIGVMNLDRSGQARAFQPWQVELARAIGGQLALSLSNSQLYVESQERLRETQVLLAVGQALSRPAPIEELFRQVAREIARGFGADMVGIHVMDARREVLEPIAGYHVPPHLTEPLRQPFVLTRMPVIQEAFSRGHAVASSDVKNDSRFDQELFERIDPHAVLMAPTPVRGEPVGAVFVVWWGTGRTFTPAEHRLLEGVASQIGLAMENEELARQTQAKLRETETLLSVSRALASTTDLQELLRQFLRQVVHAVGADSAGAWLLAPDGEWLEPVAGYHFPPEHLPVLREVRLSVKDHAFYAEACRTLRPVFSGNVITDARVPDTVRAALPHRSQLFVPIVAGERIIGGFAVTWGQESRAFTESELAPLEAIASQAGIAIQNARLFEENRRRVEELSVLHGLSRALTGQLDRAAVLDVVRAHVPRVFAVRTMAVILRHETADASEVVLRLHDGVEDTSPRRYRGRPLGLVPLVLESGRPLRTADYEAECRRRAVVPLARLTPFTHWIGVPMRTGDASLGVITLSDGERAFTEADERLLMNIADLAALALRSARLYEDRTRAYGELAAAQDQLVRTEKLRALGEMASGVAHDFNNLLAAILGRAQLMLREVDEPRQRKWLEVIERSSLDGAQTVRRLQEFTRIRRDHPLVAVDFNQVIRDALDITQSRWRDEALRCGVTIDVRTALGEIPPVAGDPVELREALTNLILNAVDAMPEGGSLTLTTAPVDGGVQATIADTGTGMPESVRAKIFDPFFTTKGPQGTGLGLSMTYGIISRHGARLEVESEEGQGSTFRLTFPPAPVAEVAEAPPAIAVTSTDAPLRCLVVDDETAVGTLLGDVLASSGHQAVVCSAGADAIARFQAEPFDVVFTDLAMPGVSGWEVARAAKAHAPEVPVFMVTGFGVELSPEERVAHGLEAVLVKPLSIQQVVEAAAHAGRMRPGARPGGTGWPTST